VKKVGYILMALVVLGMSGAGVYAQPVSPGSTLGAITMNEQNGSGENGSAVLAVNGNQMTVTITVSCGDKSTLALAGGVNPGAGTPGMPTTGSGDQLGLWSLTLVGVGLLSVGVRMRLAKKRA
jgi:hypothetical protein